MINQAGTDQLDDAIDCFEEEWGPQSPHAMRTLLARFGLADDLAAVTELIRIDIELRYKHGHPIDLDEYFEEFETLLSEPMHVAQIAFEDFRSRTSSGQPLTLTRWQSLPGVRSAHWYRQIDESEDRLAPHINRRNRPLIQSGSNDWYADAEVEEALEAAGFRLLQQIGQGTFSQVYLATQNDLANRHVVLKVVEQALAEPESMATLQHTNIVPIYSFHRIHSRSVICMPYAGVVTLADFLASQTKASARGGASLVTTVLNRVHDTVTEEGEQVGDAEASTHWGAAAEDSVVLKPLEHFDRLDCNQLAIWVFGRLAAALAHSHARGVLHGDLKPANVLIRNDGEPALLDFNLSHALDQPQTKHIGGTLPYMAPESLRGLMGQTVAPDPRSDVYGLGVMLFEFVTGRLPFPSPSSAAAVDLEPAVRLRRQNPEWEADERVSVGLRAIIDRCLQYEPDDRYSSSEELQEDLQRESENRPLRYSPESARSRAAKWVRRHPRVVSGTTVAMMLSVLLIPLAIWSKLSYDQSKHFAALATLDSFAQESIRVLAESAADPLRISEEQVLAAMRPLKQYGLLDVGKQKDLASALQSDANRARFATVGARHMLQVAVVELGNLRAGNDIPVERSKLDRVDRLIEATAGLIDEKSSRAWLYVRAERARLSDDPDAQELLGQAGDMPMTGDNEFYLEAVRLMTRHRYEEARNLLNQLSEREAMPSGLRWTSLGRSQFFSHQYEEAKLSFTRALENAPTSSRLWYLRGRCHYRLKQFVPAKDDFTRAIEHEPSFSVAYTNRGLCYQSLRRHREAAEDFSEALRRSPGSIHPLILRSRALRLTGNRPQAQRDWLQAIQATDLSLDGLMTRSTAFKRRKNWQRALDDLEAAHELDRGNPALYLRMAEVLAPLGQIDKAIEMLGRSIAINPTDADRIDRAVLLARSGHDAEAIKDLESALEPPNSPHVLYQAACVHALLLDRQYGNRKQALGYLSQALLAGYGTQSLHNDPDLNRLRDDDGFRALLKTIELSSTDSAPLESQANATLAPTPLFAP